MFEHTRTLTAHFYLDDNKQVDRHELVDMLGDNGNIWILYTEKGGFCPLEIAVGGHGYTYADAAEAAEEFLNNIDRHDELVDGELFLRAGQLVPYQAIQEEESW